MPKPQSLAAIKATAEHEMACFDELPPALRQALSAARYPWTVPEIYDLWKRGTPVPVLVAAMAQPRPDFAVKAYGPTHPEAKRGN